MTSLQIEPLAGSFGAFASGWISEKPLTAQDRDVITEALRDHQVLIFRGQKQPTDEELISFAGTFGDLLQGSAFLERARDHPEILSVGNLVGDDGKPQGTGGSSEMDWHSDYSYVDRVGKETFLNAVKLPKYPPHTYFSNQYRALETLPTAMRDRLRGMRAWHSVSHYYEDSGSKDVERYRADREREKNEGIETVPILEAEHDLIVRHPETGREILYISPAIVQSIIGLGPEESAALLAELRTHSTQPGNVLAHDWEVGDVVMFDTLGTLHKRDSWDPAERRNMRQLSTVCRID